MGDETKYRATNNSQENNAKGEKSNTKGNAKGLSPVEKKAVGTLPGGKIASKVADTKLGKKAVSAARNQMAKNKLNPAMRQLGKSNSGMGKNGGLARETLKRDGLEDKKEDSKIPGLPKGLGSSNSNSNSEGEADEETTTNVLDPMISFLKKHLVVVLTPIVGHALLFLLIFVGIIGVILGPADTVIQWFRDKWDSLKTLVGYKTEEQWEQEYYERLAEVQEAFNRKYGVCIDVNLITATLTVDKHSNIVSTNEGNEGADINESDYLNPNSETDYKRMIKQIELLANMQIKRKMYGLDAAVKRANENKTFPSDVIFIDTGEDYCMEESTEYPYPFYYGDESGDYESLDTLDRKLDFTLEPLNFDFFFSDLRTKIKNMQKQYGQEIKGNPIRISPTNRHIASNDVAPGIWKFLTKKANEEKNMEYVFYVPSYTKSEALNSDGTRKIIDGKEMWEWKCNVSVPTDPYDFAQLDIGSLNDMDSVYYWNLMDSFIPDYYKDYLPEIDTENTGEFPLEEGSERFEKVKNIVEDIYLLWNEMGPNQSCSDTYNVCADETIEASCENGVTVTGPDAGTYDLETYIAGVITHENDYRSPNGSIESAKANAIAARTYVLAQTNFCQKSIRNSTGAQTFSKTPSSIGMEAANQTRGLILTYNGKIFSSQYDSYCYQDSDCRDSICQGDSCSVTYTMEPNGETHKITIPKSYQRFFISGAGHAHGMSQLLANHMSDEGSSYKEILNYFYSPGTMVTAMVDSSNEGEADLICNDVQSGGTTGSGTSGTGSKIPPGKTYDNFDGQVLVDWARKYVGNPYVWGGTSLTNGADCSGFVMTLVKDLFGIYLPHSSRAQVSYGTPVSSLAEAKPGDLLFYSNENGIHHVAIYTGQESNTRVHAYSSKTGIVETSVGNPSYIRRLG